MMNNPTRKKAKMPSFHTHQSSNRADTNTTPYYSNDSSVTSTYTEQQAYQVCCTSLHELNTKLTLALLQLNQINSKGYTSKRIPPKTPAASSKETPKPAKRTPSKIPVSSATPSKTCSSKRTSYKTPVTNTTPWKAYSSKRIPSKTPAASDRPEPAKRIPSKNSVTTTSTHTTTPSITVPSKPIPSKTLIVTTGTNPSTTCPSKQIPFKTPVATNTRTSTTEPMKNENSCPPSQPSPDVSTAIPNCSHGIENKSVTLLHNAAVNIDHNGTNLEKDRGLFEQPFDTTNQVHSITPQLKVEVLNHTHSSTTKMPPTTSIAPEHRKTPHSGKTGVNFFRLRQIFILFFSLHTQTYC